MSLSIVAPTQSSVIKMVCTIQELARGYSSCTKLGILSVSTSGTAQLACLIWPSVSGGTEEGSIAKRTFVGIDAVVVKRRKHKYKGDSLVHSSLASCFKK
jgi:enterochelin esterase-like enzyme